MQIHAADKSLQVVGKVVVQAENFLPNRSIACIRNLIVIPVDRREVWVHPRQRQREQVHQMLHIGINLKELGLSSIETGSITIRPAIVGIFQSQFLRNAIFGAIRTLREIPLAFESGRDQEEARAVGLRVLQKFLREEEEHLIFISIEMTGDVNGPAEVVAKGLIAVAVFRRQNTGNLVAVLKVKPIPGIESFVADVIVSRAMIGASAALG